MLQNRAAAPQPQPADSSRARNRADGRRGTRRVDSFPADSICELLLLLLRRQALQLLRLRLYILWSI